MSVTLGPFPKWVKSSNGFPANYLESKHHHNGPGLGKHENGRTSPVKASRTSFEGSQKKPIPKRKETVLIAGTSMIGGLDQNKMSKKYQVKVRTHPGAKLPEMRHHLNAHLNSTKVDHLILQVGTNDAAQRDSTAGEILKGILDLKSYAEELSPGVHVTISCPMLRTDNSFANEELLEVKRILRETPGLSLIVNDNITEGHLSIKGLHLNQGGTVQLAKNMIEFMKNIEQGV